MTQGTVTKKPDEIMAEYLLRGGKMLAKTCPNCGNPLFEIKGETKCVVCAEPAIIPDAGTPSPEKPAREKSEGRISAPADYPALEAGISETLLNICERIRSERDPKAVRTLMESIALGTDALRTLRD